MEGGRRFLDPKSEKNHGCICKRKRTPGRWEVLSRTEKTHDRDRGRGQDSPEACENGDLSESKKNLPSGRIR